MIPQIVKSKWTYIAIRVVGFTLLGTYLFLSDDWRVSPYGVLAFGAIAFSVSWLVVTLKIADRFPKLNRYLLFPRNDQCAAHTLTENEWALAQANYLESGLRGATILASPSEDGMICVPILVAGLGPIASVVGGVAFALLHLGRFTYVECISKGIFYALVCFFVLPHGLLNVVLGHLFMNLLALIVIKVAKRALARKVVL